MKKTFIISALVALAAVGISFVAPLSTKIVQIIQLNNAPDALLLEQGHHLTEVVRLSPGTYSAMALFSNAKTLDGRVIHVVVTEGKGTTIVAKGSSSSTSYLASEDILKIDIPLTWFTVSQKAAYTVDMFLGAGEALPLRAMAHDMNLSSVHLAAIDGVRQEAIVSLAFMQRIPAVFGLQQGILIGAAFLLAVALISTVKNERRKYFAATGILILFAPLAVLGYLMLPNMLGIADWDFYFSLHDSYRSALLTHHTFPFWDPYPCGGTAGLSDPEFSVFSPTFLLELIFGIPLGLRFAIVLSVMVGSTGMLALARRLGRSPEAGLIAALAVAFGTVNLLEITEGHVNVFAAMWIPWIFWAWLGMYRGKTKPIVCGAFLALAFLGGGIYLLMYTSLAFLALLLLVRERRRAAFVTVRAAIWAMGIASFKLVPVLFWLRQFPDDAYQSSAYTLPWIGDILFGRYLHGAYVIADQASGWHEYGAYIGYIVFALALIGASRMRSSRIVRALVFASVSMVLLSTLGPYLQGVFDLLWFFPRSNISRIILFAVIPLALLASYGADRVRERVPKRFKDIVLVLCVGFVAIDLFSLTYQVSEQAFVLPHVVPAISPAPYPIAFTPDRYDPNGEGSRTTRAYDAYKAGYGTMVYCSVLGPKPAVRTIYDEYSNGPVSTTDANAEATLLSWNYNTVRVHVKTPVDTFVVLNTNYAKGWTVNGEKAEVASDRVAANVKAGEHDVTFTYKPPGFFAGLIISLVTLLVLLVSSSTRRSFHK